MHLNLYVVQDIYVSDDIADEMFIFDLEKCTSYPYLPFATA